MTTIDDVVSAGGQARTGRTRSARVLGFDVLGVRLWVLAILVTAFVASTWLQMAGRGIMNHPPDSRYYLTMMSRDMGHPLGDAVSREHGVSPSWSVAPWYFAHNDPTWQMVRTRMLYPVLSVPFVWAFGLSAGSLAVPVLSVLLFLWVTARTVQRLYGPAAAAVAVGAFGVTTTIPSFTWAGTDTLAMALTAVIVANLPIERRVGRANLVWLGAATVLVALTRQVGVLAPAMAGAGWLWALVRERSWRNAWTGSLLVTSAVTLAMQVVAIATAPTSTSDVIAQGQTTLWGIVRRYLHSVKSVTKSDLLFLWHSDRVLLALFVAAGVAVVLRFKSDTAAVFVGAAAATGLIVFSVGSASYMRYEMVLFPAAAVMVGALVALVADRFFPRAVRAVSAEASADRRSRWVPLLVGNTVLLAVVLGVSMFGGSRSSVSAPAGPSFAAAQGGQSYAVSPRALVPADRTLKAALDQALKVAGGKGSLEVGFDWVHATDYRPTAPTQPGWSTRAADGTTGLQINGLDTADAKAFSNAITFDRTLRPDTLTILTRQTSPYGEDVRFTVRDSSGVLHTGTATTLYPLWSSGDPGVVTSLVYSG